MGRWRRFSDVQIEEPRRSRPRRGAPLSLMSVSVSVLMGAGLLVGTASTSSAATTVVNDTFQRTVGNGWGGSGYSYASTFGASRLSVSPGRGTMALNPGSTTQATLSSTSVRDVEARTTLTLSRIPSAGYGAYVGPMVRVGSNGAYRLAARFASGGSMTIAVERVDANNASTGLKSAAATPVASGQPVTLRLEASGTSSVSLTGQAFIGSSSTPAASISVADASASRISGAGSVALWSHLASTSEAGSANFTSLQVSDLGSQAPVDPPPAEPETPIVQTAAGSLPIGQAAYPAPSNAVYVATSGSDSSNGKIATPYRTITKAVNSSASGSTIVLRGGNYHETVMVPKEKTLTFQAYPREAVWLDGSSTVTGFTKSGNAWVKSDWNYIFDASPTYSRGAPDGQPPSWQFVNPAYPMAAHPDQVWINGAKQTQVGSLSQVTSGTFFVDRSARKLYVGSDPTSKTVQASTLQLSFTLLSKNSAVKGIGFRRYAPSVPDTGAVRLFGADGSTLENVVVSEMSTSGMHIGLATTTAPVRLSAVTVSDNGLMGIGSNSLRGVRADRVLVARNNSERFNGAPAAGGWKFSKSHDISITNSVFRDNNGTGLWLDEASIGVTIARNDLYNNARHGLVFELSTRGRIVNNAIWGNKENGLLVLDATKVDIWNNSIRGGLTPVRIADGTRTWGDASSEATGVMRDVTVRNNTLGDPISAGSQNWCGIMCMLDDRRISTASQMNMTTNGNLYYRATTGVPRLTIRWAGGSSGPRDFTTLAAFKQATGQESNGSEVLGTTLLDERGVLRSGGRLSGVGVSIPSDVASLGGLPAGSVLVGAVR